MGIEPSKPVKSVLARVSTVERIQVGPELVSTHGPLRRFLNSQNMLSGNTTNPDPRADRPLGPQSQCGRQGLLAAKNGGSSLDRLFGHSADSSAQTARKVNANTANPSGQTVRMVSDARKSFWDRLIEAWGARELPTSQLGIAGALSMSQGSVGRWARGEGLPELDVVRELALRGDVCIEWLLTGRGPKRPMPVDEETNELLEIWRKLKDNGRHSVRVAAQGALALQTQTAPASRPARIHSETQ